MASFEGGTVEAVTNYNILLNEDGEPFFEEATVTQASSTLIELDFGDGTVNQFRGSGITYNGLGIPTGGTIDEIEEFFNGTRVFLFSDLNLAVTDLIDASVSGETEAFVEDLWSGHDTIVGSNFGGDDLAGFAGNDRIDGLNGADDMAGGLGNDTFVVRHAGDQVVEEAGQGGADEIEAFVTYNLPNNVERIVQQGSGDIDSVGNELDNRMTGNSGENQLRGKEGDDILRGEEGDDRLFGEEGDDSLTGGDGEDRLVGDRGDDVLRGNAGDDDLFGDNNEDEIHGGGGADRIFGGTQDDVLNGNDDADNIKGQAGNDTINGGFGDDVIFGDTGEDTLNGDEDDDNIFGGTGDDDASGGLGNDRVTGNDGDDLLRGNGGADRLFGRDDDDRLVGGSGDDRLYGQDGDDTLEGGTGNDYHRGFAGNDVFVFAADSGEDVVADFVQGEDLIDVSALGITAIGQLSLSGDSEKTVIDFTASDSVQVFGVAFADIQASDFIFAT